ncbi:hypothetical protein [Methyloraptor flagellatus]|uniref:Uncharacterized protein n=1 Tax=Methyloraptor flagellatus TaxID=3162530 RepID=A0AAU7X936_9HYPH
MAAPTYLLALAAAAYAACAGLMPDRLPPGWPVGPTTILTALAVAAGLLTLGRIVQMLERLDRRLTPIEAIAARLVARTEDFDRGTSNEADTAVERVEPVMRPPTVTPEDRFAPQTAAAPSVAARTPESQSEALGEAEPHDPLLAPLLDPRLDWAEAEAAAAIFDVATPEPSAAGAPDRHRGREILRHDDGTVSVRTIAGWRRFRSLADMDDQIGPLRSFSLVEGGSRTG